MFKKNLSNLKKLLKENNIDLAVITDDDSLYYFTGYYNFLHMDFERPTILIVDKEEESVLITPLLDVKLIEENCPVEKIITWNDGIGEEWREILPSKIKKNRKIAYEKFKINATVNNYLLSLTEDVPIENITPIIIGDTIFPSINPNLNHILFKGVNIFELIKPKKRKIVETIKDQILKFSSFINGNKAIIKKTIENTIPKFLLVGNLVFLFMESLFFFDFHNYLNYFVIKIKCCH